MDSLDRIIKHTGARQQSSPKKKKDIQSLRHKYRYPLMIDAEKKKKKTGPR
tara:strand:- start:73 stop:225 length:153 start_codon:yes stop_codon:yes gene_type:complete